MLGVDRRGIVDWARRAEEAGFSSLGTIDRLAYPAFEPLTTLAAAAAVTERIGLVTDILLAPLRSNNALFAKQAATVDQLSEGRLTLGLGVGLREDDFEAAGVDFHKRGALFERQLEDLLALLGGRGPRRPGAVERRAPGDADRRRRRRRPTGARPSTPTAGRWAAGPPSRSPRAWRS